MIRLLLLSVATWIAQLTGVGRKRELVGPGETAVNLGGGMAIHETAIGTIKMPLDFDPSKPGYVLITSTPKPWVQKFPGGWQ